MFDHDYTLVVHPRLRAQVSYRREEGTISAATVRLDYRSDGTWTEEGAAVDVPEPPESGIELQGVTVSLYRDEERVMAKELSSSLVSDALGAVDAVEKVAPQVARKGKDAAQSVATKATGDRITVTQLDGTTVEALRPPSKATFEVYEGKDGKWRWRLLHDNGNVIADSGQGYSSKRSAEKGIRSVKRNALGAPVEPVGGEAEQDVRTGSDAESDGSDAGTAES